MNIKRKISLGKAEQILINHGIEKEKAPALLQELGYALTDRDIYSTEYENKQDICWALRDALLLTSNAGDSRGNALKDLKYIPEKGVVRPIFEDGTGADGWYDVNVEGDSGTAMILDIARQFIGKMW